MPFSDSIHASLRSASLVAVLLVPCLTLTGCGPAQAPSTERAAPGQTPSPGGQPNAATAPRPGREDVTAFFDRVLKKDQWRYELQTDAPVATGEPGVWAIPVKLTVTPTVDLLGAPTEADVAESNGLVEQINALVTWRNSFAESGYAKSHYPDYKVGGPESVPFLAVKRPAGKVLEPRYGKILCERQVDRWRVHNLDMDLGDLAEGMGKPRGAFPPDAVVVGSPQAQAFVAAQREAVSKAAATRSRIERDYAAMLEVATRPGMLYRGQITHGPTALGDSHGDKDTMIAEVRFTERPGGDPHAAAFTVVVPAFPPYSYTYSGKLGNLLPDKAGAADMIAHFEQGVGNIEGRLPVPGQMLRGLLRSYTPLKLPMVVSEKGIHGMIADYASGDFVLTATPAK